MRESDWKLFRKRVPEWRERYLEKKNRVYFIFLMHRRDVIESADLAEFSEEFRQETRRALGEDSRKLF